MTEPARQNGFSADRVAALIAAAEFGDAAAAFDLGCRFMEGDGVIANSRAAREWLTRAAEAGYAPAQGRLALLLWRLRAGGDGDGEIFRWAERSARAGEPMGEWLLGECNFRGIGVSEDEALARQWFLKAAERGEVHAQSRLALIHHYGLGVPVDHDEALRWVWLAAAAGDADAEAILGEMYLEGRGMEADVVAGWSWLRSAAAKGSDHAAELLAESVARKPVLDAALAIGHWRAHDGALELSLAPNGEATGTAAGRAFRARWRLAGDRFELESSGEGAPPADIAPYRTVLHLDRREFLLEAASLETLHWERTETEDG